MKEKTIKDLADPIKDIEAFEYTLVSDGYESNNGAEPMLISDEKEDEKED